MLIHFEYETSYTSDRLLAHFINIRLVKYNYGFNNPFNTHGVERYFVIQ